jgi:DNA-binding beta-propeller fold protein YncE
MAKVHPVNVTGATRTQRWPRTRCGFGWQGGGVTRACLLVACIALASFYSGGSGPLSTLDAEARAGGLESASNVSGPSGSPIQTAEDPYLYVNSTLVLANDSIFRGDFNAMSGWDPGSVLYDPLSRLLYVPAYSAGVGDSGGVFFVNLTTDGVVGGIELPNAPVTLSYDRTTDTIFAADASYYDIAELNATSNTLTALVNVSYPTSGGLYDPENNELYLTAPIQGLLLSYNATTMSRLGALPIGGDPNSIALDSRNGRLYIGDGDRSRVTIVKTSTDQILRNVSLGESVASEVVDVATNSLFVLLHQQWANGNFSFGNISQVNLSTNAVVTSTDLDRAPGGLAVGPDSDTIYVSSSSNSSLGVFNASTAQLLYWVTEPYTSGDVSYIPAFKDVIVSFEGAGLVGVMTLSAPSRSATVEIGTGPAALSYDYTLQRLYVEDLDSACIIVLNTSTWQEIGTVPVSASFYSQALAFDPRQGETFAANASLNEVNVINDTSDALVANISVPSSPTSLVYDSSRGEIFVSYYGWNHISVINTSNDTVVASIYLPSFPYTTGEGGQFAYDPSTGDVVVANVEEYQLDWINDTNNTIDRVTDLVGYPEAMGYDPVGGEIYAAMGGGSENQLAIVSDVSAVQTAQIEVGTYPDAIVYDELTRSMLVANSYSSSISIVGGASNEVLATVGTYSWPWDIAANPTTGAVYSANTDSGSLQILTPGRVVSFVETGLRVGTTWSVSLGGTQLFSTSSIIKIDAGTGRYTFSIGSVPGWTSSTQTGFVRAGDSNVTVPVIWTPFVFEVRVKEAGLPAGMRWWLNLSSGGSFSSNSTTIDAAEPNGTYEFEVSAADGWYVSPGGELTVNNSSLRISVKFKFVDEFQVDFVETGLPAGTDWWVNLSNGQSYALLGPSLTLFEPNATFTYTVGSANLSFSAPDGGFAVDGMSVGVPIIFSLVRYAITFAEEGLPSGTLWTVRVDTESVTSGSEEAVMGLPNGTFAYSIASQNLSFQSEGGILEVKGATQDIAVLFSPVTYVVVFTEEGLPSGTEWTVSVGGESLTSASPSLVFREPNGTYAYIITGPPGWHETTDPYAGQLTVHGGPSYEPPLGFVQVAYSVTISESGLWAGSDWWVNLSNGRSFLVNGPAVTFAEPNGTYSYTVATPNASFVGRSGEFQVNGDPVAVRVAFSATLYELTFIEQGLPVGTNWSVTVGSKQTYGTGTELTIALPNGTYSFAITSIAGYSTNLSAGHLTLAGAPQSIVVVFAVAGGNSGGSTWGLSSWLGLGLADWIVVGGVVAAVLVGLILLVSRRRVRPRPPDLNAPNG